MHLLFSVLSSRSYFSTGAPVFLPARKIRFLRLCPQIIHLSWTQFSKNPSQLTRLLKAWCLYHCTIATTEKQSDYPVSTRWYKTTSNKHTQDTDTPKDNHYIFCCCLRNNLRILLRSHFTEQTNCDRSKPESEM